MPLRHRGPPLGSTGFRGVRARPYGTYAVDISGGDMPVWLGSYRSPKEATPTYDAIAWRFDQGSGCLNFPEIQSQEEAEFLAPLPLLQAREDRWRHERA
jgi:hypothetical protein